MYELRPIPMHLSHPSATLNAHCTCSSRERIFFFHFVYRCIFCSFKSPLLWHNHDMSCLGFFGRTQDAHLESQCQSPATYFHSFCKQFWQNRLANAPHQSRDVYIKVSTGLPFFISSERIRPWTIIIAENQSLAYTYYVVTSPTKF